MFIGSKYPKNALFEKFENNKTTGSQLATKLLKRSYAATAEASFSVTYRL